MVDPNKRKLIIGITLIFISFLCFVGIFYVMGDMQRVKSEEMTVLEEKITVLNIEKEKIESELAQAQALSRTVSLEDVLAKSQAIYPPEEKRRREGLLWIDRKGLSYVVTLGALNGLKQGSSLAIYDGDRKVGLATVELPLDVISYVKPISKTVDDFSNDYYRAIIE